MKRHGKNDVDGHFGLLTRWYKDIERIIRILSTDVLVSAFKEKAESSSVVSGRSRIDDVYRLVIYQKYFIRGVRTSVNFSKKKYLDTRADEYAPSKSRSQMYESNIMRPACQSTQIDLANTLRVFRGSI
ncbi:hypothetical protein BB560_004604 [Smittium megazygosporum]|uniref:Uncharacterized protein n=1 Tax=Smittium megazygosporum TaxID=133381 RepID=A0A2T9Z8R2_9FUNG|nr:hypothetical protein BB560_004604 [Smittium megazygosporum]